MEYLFDDTWVDRKAGVVRVPGRPRKGDQAILAADRPWESEGISLLQGVIWDEEDGLFKMWYHALAPPQGSVERTEDAAVETSERKERPLDRHLCYATSPDGEVWSKPDLGLHEFAGDKDNNIIVKGHDPWAPLPCVVRDADETVPERRFKMLWFGDLPAGAGSEEIVRGVCVGFSADGVHWPEEARTLIMSTKELTDCSCLFPGRDPLTGKWVAYLRPRVRPKRRFVGYSESGDFVHWSYPRPLFVTESQDTEYVEFYGLTAQYVDGMYVGSLYVFHNNPVASPAFDELVYSRDNRNWRRALPQEPLLPLGEPGSPDSRSLWVAAMIPRGDEMLIFYRGTNTYHGSDYHRPMQHDLQPPPGEDEKSIIGLATLPRGHFCGLSAARDGLVETKYLFNYGRRGPRIHAQIEPEGFIRAEILDHYGEVLPGWEAEKSRLVNGEGNTFGFEWGENRLEGALGDESPEGGVVQRVVKLRFVLHRATLYGFAVGEEGASPTL